MNPRICRVCGEEFLLLPGKPGRITDCPGCSVETVAPLRPHQVAGMAELGEYDGSGEHFADRQGGAEAHQ